MVVIRRRRRGTQGESDLMRNKGLLRFFYRIPIPIGFHNESPPESHVDRIRRGETDQQTRLLLAARYES